MLCHCGGDIDDCEFDGTPEQDRCGHCADADENECDEEPERGSQPTTYGQKFIRGLLPATKEFDEPTWWEHPAETVDALRAELEMAWTIIANAGGGDWKKESSEWQEAAAKWRDRYHALMYPTCDGDTTQ